MTIGDMVVNMGLNHTGLMSGLADARRGITGFGNAIASVSGTLAGLAAPLVGLAGIASFGVMTKGAFGAIDANAKLADAIGSTTEGLIGLQHAAGLTGVGDSLVPALKKMTVGLGQAQAGAGSMGGVLAELGLSAEGLAGLDPTDAFKQISESLAGLPTQSEKARAAVAIFGRGAVDLLPLLDQGAEGIDAMAAEAERLGITFSRVDAAKLEAANDAMFRAKQAVQGLANQAAIGLAPMIESLADGFTGLMERANESFGGIGSLMQDTTDVAAWAFANIGDVAKLGFLKAYQAVVTFGGQVQWVFTSMIPDVLSWATNNWQDLFITWANGFEHFWGGLATNIKNLFGAVFEWISSGGTSGWNFAWTPMITGFENTIKTWPTIAEREMGALEQQLVGDVERLSGRLGESLGDFMASRETERAMADGARRLAGAMALDIDDDGPGTLATRTGGGSSSGPAAMQVGSKEALSGIVKAAAAQRDAASALTAKQHLAEAKKSNQLLEQLVAIGGPGDGDELLDL